MLYVIGLGLSDEKDITVKGLEVCSSIFSLRLEEYLADYSPSSLRFMRNQAVKRCERVYLEAYTSILMVPKERLVSEYMRVTVTLALMLLVRRRSSTEKKSSQLPERLSSWKAMIFCEMRIRWMSHSW
jgi:diphthamide biosynthesis methyltransferase